MRGRLAGALLALVLAACTQAPAPVIVVPADNGTTGTASLPPLPPAPPSVASEDAAVPAPPLPTEKPSPPGGSQPVADASGSDNAASQSGAQGDSLSFAQVEAALLGGSPESTASVPTPLPQPSGGGTIIVKPGDTIDGLSSSHGVAARDIIDANHLTPPYTLVVGQKLRIPARHYYTVQPGDTLYGIARQFGQSSSAIVAANGLKPPYTLMVGQRLSIPGGGQTASASAVPEPTLPARGKLQFIWPVDGKVISSFGPKPNGLHNDGINIAAPAGTPVVAAEDGVVAYVGNELKGYGNLVLIKHADGWVTAYAHNAQIRVVRGQRVKRGQIIATVGASGGVDRPQVHFELRHGSAAVDPTKYLVHL